MIRNGDELLFLAQVLVLLVSLVLLILVMSYGLLMMMIFLLHVAFLFNNYNVNHKFLINNSKLILLC